MFHSFVSIFLLSKGHVLLCLAAPAAAAGVHPRRLQRLAGIKKDAPSMGRLRIRNHSIRSALIRAPSYPEAYTERRKLCRESL